MKYTEKDGPASLRKLVPDPLTRALLLQFWDDRRQVPEADRCRAPLTYPDGTTERCVLDRLHLEGDVLRANVPHAGPDGRLAALLVRWETIAEVRRVTARLQKEQAVKFTFQVAVTVPPGGSEDAGDYAYDLAEATSAIGFDVGPFELVQAEEQE